ncbi:unnamed protein product [Parnassius apollo]|uniref:(apollo) hypothetical protein n=1 Tax=Parnassius apollo TaxID=110799 RepID=A0A8S3WEJ3_PARAO|nr:unnamed protein product [Parnassius apollo]
MTLKLLIYMSLIIWHVNSQRSQTPIMYQQNVPDIYNSGQIFFENSHYLHPQINSGYTINSHDNKFSREYDKNTRQILVDNRFEPNNKVSYGQKQIQTQQPIYQHTVQPDQKIYNEDNIHSDGTRTTIAQTTIDEDISSKLRESDTGKLSQNTNFDNKTFAITSFGLKLLKGMSRDPGNILASPYSIAMLLALIQQGAFGETQNEITKVLQLMPESSAELFKGLTNAVQKRKSHNILKIASNVVLADSFSVDPKFKSIAIHNFESEVTNANFNKPLEVSQMINNWVAAKTNNKILNLLAPDALQLDTLAVLVNAIYFKGIWDTKFRIELTKPKTFYLSNGSRKVVPFMHARRMFQTDIDPEINSQVLLIPFEKAQYSMMIILPFEGVNALDVLSSLTEQKLYAYQTFTAKEVQLDIPRFTVKSERNIFDLLNFIGIWRIFSNEANLTGIGTYQGITPRISTAVHNAVLSIDEQGGSAAAATAFSVVALSNDDSAITFRVNRPFLIVLWDSQLNVPLFMGKIEDPTS